MSRRPLLWLAAAWGGGAWLAWYWAVRSEVWLGLAAAAALGAVGADRPPPIWRGRAGPPRAAPRGGPARSTRLADWLVLAATLAAGGGAWSARVEELAVWPGLAYRSQGAVRRPALWIEGELVDWRPLPPHRRPGWELRIRPRRAWTDARTGAGSDPLGQSGGGRWDGAQILVTVERTGDPFFSDLTPAEQAITRAFPGDTVRTRVELRLPAGGGNPGEFRYATYLARQGVLAVAWAEPEGLQWQKVKPSPWTIGAVRRTLFAWRQSVLDQTGAGLDWPYAGILRGICWGDRRELPEAVEETFRRAGASHLLAVSGFNVGLVVAAVWAIGRALGWSHAGWRGAGWRGLAISLVGLYLLLIGPGGSPARAGVMAIVGLLVAPYRRLDRLNLLGGAALCLWILNPLWVFDIGLLLSVSATAGLIVGTRPLCALGERALPWLPPRWQEAWALSVAAWLSTLPLVWNQFAAVSPYGVITNLWVSPLVGLLLPLAGARCLLQILPSAGVTAWLDCGLAQALEVGLRALWWGLQRVSAWPGSLIDLPPAGPWLWLAALSLAGLLGMRCGRAWRGRDPFDYLGERRRYGGPDPRVWMVVGVALAISGPRWSIERHLLRIWYLDVGQGDAALLQVPGQPAVLVDGGPANAGRVVSQFVHRQVGRGGRIGLVVSHPHSDHEQGLVPLLENGKVSWWVHAPWGAAEPSVVQRLIGGDDPPAYVLDARHAGFWGASLRWQVLWPPPPDRLASSPAHRGNDLSLVFALRYGRCCLVFTGDSEAASQRVWGGVAQRSPWVQGAAWHVLKLPHHGAASAGELVRWPVWRPGFAIVSVGRNPYGQPSDALLAAWTRRGFAVYQTDRMGAIRLRTDGWRLWVAGRRFDPTQLRRPQWEERSLQ